MSRELTAGSRELIGSEVSVFSTVRDTKSPKLTTIIALSFFGPQGATSWVPDRLRRDVPGYDSHALDVCDRRTLPEISVGRPT
jgi:hypothetical protein